MNFLLKKIQHYNCIFRDAKLFIFNTIEFFMAILVECHSHLLCVNNDIWIRSTIFGDLLAFDVKLTIQNSLKIKCIQQHI